MVEVMRGMKYSHPDWFRFSAVKYLLDGAPFSGSGAYSGIAHPGTVRISLEELRRRLTDHTRRGEQVAPKVGVLSAGKLGDVVILSRDPRGLDAQGIMGITVERTIVGGRTTYRAQSTASARPQGSRQSCRHAAGHVVFLDS
jgi:hypothetical protein